MQPPLFEWRQDVDKVNRLSDTEKPRKARKRGLQMRAHTQVYVTDFAARVDDVSRNFNFIRSCYMKFLRLRGLSVDCRRSLSGALPAAPQGQVLQAGAACFTRPHAFCRTLRHARALRPQTIPCPDAYTGQ